MNTGKTIFAQVMEHLPLPEFRKCVQRYHGNYKIKTFSCLDQFLVMAFAQLSYRESLRDIEVCLRAMRDKLYHRGIRGGISRNNLAHANEIRDWRIWADFAQVLIHTARHLYADDPFGVELEQTVYAFDSTTIDLRGNIPSFIQITEGKVHDVNVLDDLICPDNFLCRQVVSRKTPARPLLRSRKQQTLMFPDQQFSATSFDHCPTLQMLLASGTIFQMDQATPENQGFLRNLRERGQDSGPDSCLDLCAGGHSQKAIGPRPQPLHNSTDSQRHAI